MDLPTFQALRCGNIITAVGAPKLMVTDALRDVSGNTLWIACGGIAYGVADIAELTLIDSIESRAKVSGQAGGAIVLVEQSNTGGGWTP